jgi:hypothetical protein
VCLLDEPRRDKGEEPVQAYKHMTVSVLRVCRLISTM